MDLVVHPARIHPVAIARWGRRRLRCALGRGGVTAQKREGDGGTPVGAWPMRQLFYRADRIDRPDSLLPTTPIGRADGWCDGAGDARYNRFVRLPHGASAERLWLDDRVYDVIVPLGYNDVAIKPGAGSAIFLHVARPDYAPTEGCVALALDDLLEVLATASARSRVIVRPR